MIQVRNLVYEYTDKRALDNVSFEINDGAITALVGPNGAGKTTLLRSLAALSKPLSGEVFIDGYSTIHQPREVHLRVGYLSDFFGLYDSLTVEQSLQFTAHSRLSQGADIDRAVQTAINRAGVAFFFDKKISALSRGMRQRVGIAQAIIHQPKVLLLDEPASGLDPEARHSLSVLLTDLRDSGMTIIVSSHILAELEDYSTEMLVIQDGKMIEHRNFTHAGVVKHLKPVMIKLESYTPDLAEQLNQMQGVTAVQTIGETQVILQLDESLLTRRMLLKNLVTANIPVEEFAEHKINLQDEYIKTVSEYKKSKV